VYRGRRGDAELDELLEGFDDLDDDIVDIPDGAEGQVHVGIVTAVEAICAAIGLKNPMLDPWGPEDGDVELLFRPTR